MNNYEKKKWLRSSWAASGMIDELEESYREVYEAATSVTANYGGSGSGNGNPHKFDKVAEYGSRLTDAINELAARNTKIVDAINTLENITYRQIMFKRYVRNQSWEKIAEDMHYTRRHITRLHGIALTEIQIPDNVL